MTMCWTARTAKAFLAINNSNDVTPQLNEKLGI